MRRILLIAIMLVGVLAARAADYKTSEEYLTLRDSMHNAFNSGDSTRFFMAVKTLEDYLKGQDDLHAYYTQRCNEIVFLMNTQKVFEAFKLARQLSQELQERKLDKEMYMAYNMLGHLNRYCGNKETAKRLFKKVIDMMEVSGYYESMPPIYMNIVNVELDDDPEEAHHLLERALEIARQYSPERVFDIETRKSLIYFNSGDIPHFLEGYKKYRAGVAEGKTSVHGRSMDVYYEACTGSVDKAVAMAREQLGEDGSDAVTIIYERAGRWQEAFDALKRQTAANDSVNNVILSNSLEDYRSDLRLYDMERRSARTRTIAMSIIILLLSMLIVALAYITFSRRRHIQQLKRAYDHALESDKMKTAFLQNMSHEVRTPLNVIAGFAQVLANPELTPDTDKQQEMAEVILKNTDLITSQVDEMLELALNESTGSTEKHDTVVLNAMLRELVKDYGEQAATGVEIKTDYGTDEQFVLLTHKDMLRRAVGALLDNAVKNTTKGSITVRTTEDTGSLKIIVEDTGCGVPAKEAEHIFERFYKIDTFKTGLGLGLTLCRNIVTRLGGTINLDTTYTNGARFVITLNKE